MEGDSGRSDNKEHSTPGMTIARRVRSARPPVRAGLAWAVLTLTVALAVTATVIGFARGTTPGVPAVAFRPADLLIYAAFLAWVVVGALISSRRPENRIGWILSAAGMLVLLSAFSREYAVAALLDGWSALAAGPVFAWLGSWTPVAGLGLFFYLLLLFPDGHLPSTRWRPAAWVYGLVLAAGILSFALLPGPFAPGLWNLGPIQNPLGVSAAEPALRLVNGASRVLIAGLYLAAVWSLLLRLRRARGVERQQITWVAYAAVMLIGFLLAVNLIEGRPVPAVVNVIVEIGFFLLGVVGIPAAVAVAILRYRLYDIDRIINRTLVYGSLTAILGLGYASVVLALGQLSGQSQSNLAVAGATLAMAAVFQPLRRRIQQAVDRRFNRRRYDAATAITSFSTRLRDEIELDTLSPELLALVDQTVQPALVALWLRGDAAARS